MSKLFIANCTMQVQRVMYRLDVNDDGVLVQNSNMRAAKHQDVPVGRQVSLGGDMTGPQIQYIVDQLSKFGLCGTVDRNRLPSAVVPYLFSIDKPVSENDIRAVFAHNKGALKMDGETRLQQSAIAATQVLPDAAAMDISVEQDHPIEEGEGVVERGF